MSTYFIKITRGDRADVENSTETMKWIKKLCCIDSSSTLEFLAAVVVSQWKYTGTDLWVSVGSPSLTCINHFESHWLEISYLMPVLLLG